MERPLWKELYRVVASVPYSESRRRRFGDRAILLVYFWAVIYDRPTVWACSPENWPDDLRPDPLPLQPTMSRRLRSSGVMALLNALTRHSRRRRETRLRRAADRP